MKSKRDRFKKVAERRVQSILQTLRLLGNCSNKGNYEYDEKDVRKMFEAIHEQLKETEHRFIQNIRKDNKEKFRF